MNSVYFEDGTGRHWNESHVLNWSIARTDPLLVRIEFINGVILDLKSDSAKQFLILMSPELYED